MGCFGKMFLGWIGAFLGQLLFGAWGPSLNGTAIIPSILGAMILLAIFWERGS
jgi:glsB